MLVILALTGPLTPLSTTSSGGLELNSPNGIGAGAARAEMPVRGRSLVNTHTSTPYFRELGVLGIGVDETFSGIGVDSGVALGKGGQLITDWIETDLRPAEEEVILQFDTFDDVLKIWAMARKGRTTSTAYRPSG